MTMLGSSPITRLRARLSVRASLYLLAATSALGIACSEGRLPTGPGGFTPMPAYVRLDATVANTGRAMKVVARYAKRTDTLQVTPFDSATLTLTGAETQLPVTLDLARCLAAGDRELPTGLPADQSASVCVLRLVVTLLDATNQIIDQSVLAPIVARPGEEAQAPPVSLGILVGKVTVAPRTATLNALGATTQLAATVLDRQGQPIAGAALTYRSLTPTIVTVDSSTGRVTALAVGAGRVSVTSRDHADTATISVQQVPKTLTITPSSATIAEGDSIALATAVVDSGGSPIAGATVTLASSDTLIARINAPRTHVVGRVAGSATVTATSGALVATMPVTVRQAGVASVTVAPNLDTVTVGQTLQLTATVRDSSGRTLTGRTLGWRSSDTTKATVSGTGLVSGRAAGSVTVTAQSGTSGPSGSVTVTVRSGAPTGTSTLAGVVLVGSTGDPLAGATVDVMRGTTLVSTTRSGADGRYTVSSLPDGAASVRFSATGYVSATIDSILIAGATTADPAPLAATSASSGVITGTTLDATTNAPTTARVTLELRAGISSTSGAVLQTVQADSLTGTYTFAPTAAGTYTVLARATGYTDAHRTAVANGGTTSNDQRIVLSPTAAPGAVRIVLTWGDTPPDLDSHLTGPDSAGAPFHVYYGAQGDCTVNPFACLDVDATNGFGPETITLSRQNAGTYRFMVNNYSVAGDSAAATDESLARSGARVDLYINNSLARSFSVPAGQGTLWTVFELNGTTLTPINTISADPPPDDVGTTAGTARQQDRARVLRDIRAHPKRIRTR